MSLLMEKKKFTYADFLDWDEGTRIEIIDGDSFVLDTPPTIHQLVSGPLGAQLYSYLKGKTGEVFWGPLAVRLFEKEGDRPEDVRTVVLPDIIVICDPAKLDEHGCKGAPDLIIEILSPSTSRRDRLVKYDLYQRAGVREYWIVDPSARTVAVHLLDEGQYGSPDFYTGEAVVPVSVLEGCQIDLNAVFSNE